MVMAEEITVTTAPEAEIELFPVGNQAIDLVVRGTTSGEEYTGPFNIIPTDEQQIINIAQKVSSRNITVGPIPNCYGLIGWDGSVLTVS